ncbi:MAG: hypothetical protein KatS3mg031_2493 [Chitinophagales bacterium]|nr:MAG: hypothetical protein KatS3mg031_2493 [Chitinophagales bacterium]
MAYRVDNVPFYLKPLFFVYAYTTASVLYTILLLLHASCKIIREGHEHPPPFRNHIYASWHENLIPYFAVYVRYKENYAWINHPLWFMKPVHIILKWMGLKKLFLGSSGHGGRAAMLHVSELLQAGYNTFINPDGPAGPPKIPKPGVLEMSRLSGIPIVPIRFELSHSFRLPGWDKKKVPLPFSVIKIIYGQPLSVHSGKEQESNQELIRQLG